MGVIQMNYSRHHAQNMLDQSVSWEQLRTIKANLVELEGHLLAENKSSAGKKANPFSNCLTLEEVKVFNKLIELIIHKKKLLSDESQLYPALPDSKNKEGLSSAILKSIQNLFIDDNQPENYGLVKLITSSKAVEREVKTLCNNIKARFESANKKTDKKNEKKTLRERIAYKFGQVLAAFNAFGVGVSFVGILISSFIWPLPAVIIVGSLVFAVGGIVSWNMNKGSLPEIIADIIGKKNLFDELHKDLESNKKVALWIGFGLALFTGIVTAAFTWSAVVFLFSVMSLTLTLSPLALAIFIVNAVAVSLLMFKSIHQLAKEPELWHRFKKFFRQLFDPDAAQHKMYNKSKARVYIEGVLAVLILPIAIVGLITTILAFIPGLSQFALQHLPSAPRAVVNAISYIVGVVAALGEMPFTLKTMGLSVRQLFEAIARLKNKTYENAKLMREAPENYSKWGVAKEYASATGVFLGRLCYAFTQGLINVDGSFGGGLAKFLSGFCGAIDAFAEVAEGDDNEEARGDESNLGDGNDQIGSSNESTVRLLNFFKDVEGRANRKEEIYAAQARNIGNANFKKLFFDLQEQEPEFIFKHENIQEVDQVPLLCMSS